MLRTSIVLTFAWCFPAYGTEVAKVEDLAKVETPNFVVLAKSKDLAATIGERAEAERKRCAVYWFGHDVPAWEERCLISETSPILGVTFNASDDKLWGFQIGRWGEHLPSYICLVLLVQDYGWVLPRWTEAATDLMTEAKETRRVRRRRVRRAIANETTWPIDELFAMKEYPGEMQLMLDQSASVAEFLLKRSDRTTFLAFIERGTMRGWNQAVQRFYGFRDCSELEAAWTVWLTKQ